MDGCSKIFSIFAITKCSYMKETLLDAYRKVHFAIMAIEASAKKQGINFTKKGKGREFGYKKPLKIANDSTQGKIFFTFTVFYRNKACKKQVGCGIINKK